MAAEIDSPNRTRTNVSLHLRAQVFEAGLWGFMLTMLAGSCASIWLGEPFLSAVRQAQMQFVSVWANDDPAGYPDFVRNLIAEWPARLAAYPRHSRLAISIAFFVMIGIAVFRLVATRSRGREFNPTTPRSAAMLARAKELAGFQGRVFQRTDGSEAAISTRGIVYLPIVCTQWLRRWQLPGSPQRIAFLIVHERSHARSSDNLLWSLGAIATILVTGLVVLLLGQFTADMAIIVQPDAMVSALPSPVVYGLVAVTTLISSSLFASVAVGTFLSFIAAREYFADARATMLIGSDYLPYDGTEDLANIGSALDPWRLGCAEPDRRLHALGIWPRTSALMACCIGLWSAVRALLAIVSGIRLIWISAIFDTLSIIWIGTMLWALPRRAVGARDYRLVPLALLIAVIGILGATMVAIDSFATRFAVPPFFGCISIGWTTLIPIVTATAFFAAWLVGGEKPADCKDVDRRRPRGGAREILLFLGGIPAWAVSLWVGGMGLFVLANIGTDVVLSPRRVADWNALDLIVVMVLLPVSMLVAKNLRSPSRWSAVCEALSTTVVTSVAVWIGIAIVVANTSHPPGADGPPVDIDALTAEIGSGVLLPALLWVVPFWPIFGAS